MPARSAPYGASLGAVATIALSTIILMIPALLNGAPFVMDDTVTYLNSGFGWVPEDRTVFYGLFCKVYHLGRSPWPIVAFQCAAAAVVISMTAHHIFNVRDPRWQIAIVAALTLASSLPWQSGRILPDIFAPLLITAALLVVVAWERLAIWERAFLLTGIAGAVAMHQSHVLLAFGTPLVILPMLLLGWRPAGPILQRISALGLAALVGVTAIVGSNWAVGRGAVLSTSSGVFLLGRLLQDGTAMDLLEAECPTTNWKICAELPDLKNHSASGDNGLSDHFLWGGPMTRLGGPLAYTPEATIISRMTVARYPLRTVLRFARNTLDQLTQFDVRFNKMEAAGDYNYFGNIFGPKSQSRLENSLQSRGLLPFGLISAWLNAVVVASILLVVVAWARLRNDDRFREIFFFAFGIALFLIGNAAITGGLSGVFVRYQARVVWLIPMTALMLAASYAHRRTRFPSNVSAAAGT